MPVKMLFIKQLTFHCIRFVVSEIALYIDMKKGTRDSEKKVCYVEEAEWSITVSLCNHVTSSLLNVLSSA